MTTPPDALLALPELIAAATELPWLVDDDCYVSSESGEAVGNLASFWRGADVSFVVAAVNALPELLACLGPVITERDEARGMCVGWQRQFNQVNAIATDALIERDNLKTRAERAEAERDALRAFVQDCADGLPELDAGKCRQRAIALNTSAAKGNP